MNKFSDSSTINTGSTPSGFAPPKSWKIKSGNSDIINDLKNCNPHFNEGKAYQINCQKCVPTYEMRRRGYDVEAFPTYSDADIVKNRWDKFFKNAQIEQTKGDPKAEITKALLDYGDGARIQVYINTLTGMMRIPLSLKTITAEFILLTLKVLQMRKIILTLL